MVKLSIIIPHYNSIHTLKRLIRSIPITHQIEVLIIDDQSQLPFDHLIDHFKYFEHPYLHFFENDTHQKGAGACRNIGLEKARGRFVLFADADDFFVDQFYNIVRPYLTSDYDVIYFTPTSKYEESSEIAPRHFEYETIIKNFITVPNRYHELWLRYKFKPPWSKLIALDFIKKHSISFDPVIASNDVMFSTKVGHHMKHFIALDQTIYCVTQTKGSLTKRTNIDVFNARVDVFIEYAQFLKTKLSSKEYENLNIHGRYHLTQALLFKLSLKTIFKTYMKLQKNGIKVFDFWLLNPLKLLKKVREKKHEHHVNKDLYQK
ncbi:Glycosyltransferase involved in cell wall bisynthesis [Pelagirhabdus alkalitolerans]|uniref:Glycosyltransferase involved in cell wall bisynthesis n=1 Tax=Pelagirhabdus alkalitolerans TaxID=1612202 RepID=A0A1G6GG75_9BACI|nr:glycosyltransferase family 2 protein [Pelagirhabdus alkalitolerans]SDB81022.1 Glycosyltransferase involved in cell wall bisynthesis [Pelagirhabdus alkalitolerans]